MRKRLGKLRVILFDKRKQNNATNTTITSNNLHFFDFRSYEFNAIDNAGDRMINGGVLSEDASSNKSGNEIRDSNTHSDFSTGSSSHLESMKVRRENILSELVDTESKYVIDLNEVLVNYRDKLAVSNLTETRQRANTIFGNLGKQLELIIVAIKWNYLNPGSF